MRRKLYVALFLLPLTMIAGSDSDFIEQLFQYLKHYHLNYPQEKIYIQTDKTFYKQNERVWYKAFLLNSTDNRASEISDVIYVELRDPKGNVIDRKEHSVQSGVTYGEFLLSENAVGGLYSLVAYTQWQKNWGEEMFFRKEITVQKVITPRLLLRLDFEKRAYGPGDDGVAILSVADLRNVKTTDSQVKAEVKISGKTIQTIESLSENGEARITFRLPDDLNTSDGLLQVVVNDMGIEESISRSIPIVLNKIKLQFFPEGGWLVENVQGKVAFEALNEFGKGADVSGRIIDENDVEVADFESFHLGMGAFEFTPKAGKIYYAKIEKPQGDYAPVRLPQAKTAGYSLNLKSLADTTLMWTIYSPENNSVLLVGQTQGIIYYSEEIMLQKGYNTVNVNLNEFPVGVAVFTLFDENYHETCERLVYVNPQNGLQISLTTDKEFYKPLEDVRLTVRTTDKDNRPVAASLGVSVVDEQLLALADDKQDNLLSYVLFSSELKGKIQEPSFYFDKNESKAQEAIDFLMLTHGWRRFTWQDVLQAKKVEIIEPVEKVTDIYGYVLDRNNKSRQTTVCLIEYGGKRRVAKMKTTKDGQFAFHNIDFSDKVLLVTPYSQKIHFFNEKPINVGFEGVRDLILFDNFLVEKSVQEMDEKSVISGMEGLNEPMISDNNVLGEEILVSYGLIRNRSTTGVVQSVTASDFVAVNDFSTALAGRVAGVMAQRGDAGNQNSHIFIRGISSLRANSQPLFVLDGVPLMERNSSDISLLRMEDISRIEISTATAFYDSPTANGVIFISTTGDSNFRQINKKTKYAGLFVGERQFYNAETFNQTIHNPNQANTTVYWNANVTTDSYGEASLTFQNNQNTSSFRITAEGFSASTGLIGSSTHQIATTQPFSVDVKTPLFASTGDKVRLPVLLTNTTQEAITAKVSLKLPDALLPDGLQVIPDFSKELIRNFLQPVGSQSLTVSQELIVEIQPESVRTVYLAFTPTQIQGEHEFMITATTPDFTETITRPITVRTVYFPQSLSLAGRKMEDSFSFKKAGEIVEGSFRAELVCYTNTHEELFAGLGSILREPYGCFEQVSSSVFPNIMALQTMEASGEIDEEIRRRALDLLEQGYKKLIPYEVSGGGFDWYGRPPASTALTAYGLLEFYEMSKVYNKVNVAMMERTRKFLLDSRNNKGGFENKGLVWSETSQEVCNAYVVYVLSEVKAKEDYSKQYQTALQEALNSKDMYRLALMANAAHNRNDLASYNNMMQHFEKEINSRGFGSLQTQTSITRSGGIALSLETVALWTIALLKPDNPINPGTIDKCIDYIASKRNSFGGFGNTQATILCLQALTNYANSFSRASERGQLNLSINGNNTMLDLSKKQMSSDITKYFKQGDNDIHLKFADVENPLSYNIQLTWEYKTPSDNGLCPLALTTELAHTTVKRNETVRLAVTLENKEAQSYPMSVAIIGVPGGMSLQSWQLKEMQEQEKFDFYEIINDNLVLYFRSVQPNERKTINLDLKAEIPGFYTGMASTTYIYYASENKCWIKGMSMTIEE